MGAAPDLSKVKGFDRFIRRLKRTVAPSRVLLYGSRARSEHLRTSDLDLLIVSDRFEGMGWRERIQLVCGLWDGEVALEPLCYTEAEFAQRSKEVSIVREAARTGVRLPV